MKKILLFVLISVISVLSVAAQETGIVWEKNFDKAKQIARKTGKPLLLDFTADWCKPCQVMEKEFWVREDVIQAMKAFVPVKLNYDNETGLARKYGAAAIPFVVFADPLGDMITFRRGFSSKNAREISMIFEEMPKNFDVLLPAYDALDANKADSAALLKIADAYRSAKLFMLSSDYYKKALKTPEVEADAEKNERISGLIGINYYTARDYDNSAKYLADFLKNFPLSKNRQDIIFALTLSNAYRGKTKEAEKNLELLKKEFPDSTKAAQAAAEIEKAKSKK